MMSSQVDSYNPGEHLLSRANGIVTAHEDQVNKSEGIPVHGTVPELKNISLCPLVESLSSHAAKNTFPL